MKKYSTLINSHDDDEEVDMALKTQQNKLSGGHVSDMYNFYQIEGDSVTEGAEVAPANNPPEDEEALLVSATNLKPSPNFLLTETSKVQDERLRRESPYGQLATWRTFRFIVKSGDDLRQEQLAMQLIAVMDQIFRENSDTKNLWLRPYEIIATHPGCGIIEFLDDSMSLDYIKRRLV